MAYFLSEPEDAGAEAGAAEALEVDAGDESLLAEAAAATEGTSDEVVPPSLLLSLLDADGLALPYPSAYQPPPLKAIAGAEMTRSSRPPQCGQTVISVSENFWIFSVWSLHSLHSYS